MPTQAEILRIRTYQDTDDVAHRVFYTLTDDEKTAHFRTAKLLALLTQELYSRGVLDDENLDQLLFQCVT